MMQLYDTYAGNEKLASLVRELHQDVAGTFKNSCLLDFLNLPEPHLEADTYYNKQVVPK
jgi:hypothetical protein